MATIRSDACWSPLPTRPSGASPDRLCPVSAATTPGSRTTWPAGVRLALRQGFPPSSEEIVILALTVRDVDLTARGLGSAGGRGFLVRLAPLPFPGGLDLALAAVTASIAAERLKPSVTNAGGQFLLILGIAGRADLGGGSARLGIVPPVPTAKQILADADLLSPEGILPLPECLSIADLGPAEGDPDRGDPGPRRRRGPSTPCAGPCCTLTRLPGQENCSLPPASLPMARTNQTRRITRRILSADSRVATHRHLRTNHHFRRLSMFVLAWFG
jgi:hypothetical protein